MTFSVFEPSTDDCPEYKGVFKEYKEVVRTFQLLSVVLLFYMSGASFPIFSWAILSTNILLLYLAFLSPHVLTPGAVTAGCIHEGHKTHPWWSHLRA